MSHFLTQESHGKVFGLLGIAMFSMAFMFGVSVTDASFGGTAVAVHDAFGTEQIMAQVDVASNSYSNFLAANLINPLQENYSVMADNTSWVLSNSKEELASMMGVDLSGMKKSVASNSASGKVAGASTSQYASGGFNIDSLYSFLVQ